MVHAKNYDTVFILTLVSFPDTVYNKKAELSQSWPHDAPYIWVPWKFSSVPDYTHGYFPRNS